MELTRRVGIEKPIVIAGAQDLRFVRQPIQPRSAALVFVLRFTQGQVAGMYEHVTVRNTDLLSERARVAKANETNDRLRSNAVSKRDRTLRAARRSYIQVVLEHPPPKR